MIKESEIQALVEENKRRYDELFDPDYDPMTGYHCHDFDTRVVVEIPDFFIPRMWVPRECMSNLLFRNVIDAGTIERFITDCWGKQFDEKHLHLVWFELCKVRFREDPEFAMFVTDKIEDKVTGEMIPFRLNHPQRKLLALYEGMRKRGVPIRAIILKARQWGGSTLTQLYIKWIQDFRHDGWNSIILSQVKSTSKKIKAMYRKAIENQPGWTVNYPGSQLAMSPYENSTDDFQVTDGLKPLRRSTITIASFDNFDNVRGSNFHCAHYSEVAYWKQTPEHDPEAVISSISGGIRNQPDNVEVFESTGRGASGFFYDRCQMSMNDPNDAYKFIFIPFFIIENDTIPVDDPHAFARWLLENRNRITPPTGFREEGKFFWRMWKLGATFEAINWYRYERNKYKSHAYMATEAPIDEVEAFRNSGNLIFNPYSIDELKQDFCRPPMYQAYIELPQVSNTNAANSQGWYKGSGKSRNTYRDAKIRYVKAGERGELKIWNQPNNHILHIKNRYVVAVDIGGNSPSSDYTVMTVLDRMGMLPGMSGIPQVVARYRGHCRHDILAWKAAALAHYYDDALLVIESNTADRERDNNTEGDHFGTIIEEIADYYDNLYQRSTGPEAVQDKITLKYGFQTNKLTKGWLIDNLIAFVDDKLWDEPDEEMYRELRIYERKEDGTMGNIKSKDNHDDVLMATGIALWVSNNDMDRPKWGAKKKKGRRRRRSDVTEATI